MKKYEPYMLSYPDTGMGIGHGYRSKSQIRSFRIIRIRGHGSGIRLGYGDLALKFHASKTLYRLIYYTFIKIVSIAHKSHKLKIEA